MLKRSEPRRPPEESLQLVDAVAARIEPDEPELREWFSSYRSRHRTRLASDLAMVKRLVTPPARILECGAVPLLTTAALVELGYEVRAVDIAPERFAATIESLGLEVDRCDVETEPLPFADETFDALLFNELFEHLRINPVATLREVRRVLRPEGLLILSTPNLRSFRGVRNLLFRNLGSTGSGDLYREYRKLETLGHMGHVREYTTREVATLLARVGFRVDEVIYRGGYGRGVVGLAEQLAPTLRPFFALVAAKVDTSR